jgi:predicted  nucleic acid-binding Zn-ribbon protein
METTNQRKSFWQRPEGKTGMLFGLAMLAAMGWGLFVLLPTLLVLATNTLYLLCMIAAIGAVSYVLLDSGFRNCLKAAYQVTMRKLTGLVIAIDPIEILKGYVEDLQKHLDSMDSQMSNLRGKMKGLKQTIDTNASEMNNDLALASKARETGKAQLMALKARSAGRLKDSNLTLQQLYDKMDALYQKLLKWREAASFTLEDLSSQIKVKEKEYSSIKAASSAFRSALKVLNGDSDEFSLYQQSLEFIADDMNAKMGEIEHFMDISANFVDSVDVQNGLYKEKGLEMLEAWENSGGSTLLLTAEKNPMSVLDGVTIEPEKAKNKYRKIIAD